MSLNYITELIHQELIKNPLIYVSIHPKPHGYLHCRQSFLRGGDLSAQCVNIWIVGDSLSIFWAGNDNGDNLGNLLDVYDPRDPNFDIMKIVGKIEKWLLYNCSDTSLESSTSNQQSTISSTTTNSDITTEVIINL